MRSLLAFLFTSMAVCVSLPAAQPTLTPRCAPPDSKGERLLTLARWWGASTDSDAVAIRASLQVEAIPVSEITLVTDEAVCQRAVDSLNAVVARQGGQPGWSRPYVIRFGSSHHLAHEPHPDPEARTHWSMMSVLDSTFSQKRVLAF